MKIQRSDHGAFAENSVGNSLFALGTLVSFLAVPPNALGQETDKAASGIEEIVVTAQKRNQNLQDIPMSITALTATTIEDSGLMDVQDLAQMVPGLIFTETIGRQNTAPSIRGIAPFGFSDPTVAVMIDGYTSGFQRSGNNATLLDLERIEVLKGPQASLYGRNSIGGVINYITKKPDDNPRGDVRVDAGTYDTYVAQASISGPIVRDAFYGGVALGYRRSGGYMDNDATGAKDVNDEEDINGRLNLRWTATERLEFGLTVDHNKADDAAGDPSYAYQEVYESVDPPPPTQPEVAAGALDLNNVRRAISQINIGGFDRNETTTVLNIVYDLGGVSLTSITGASSQETSIRTSLTRLATSPLDFDVRWDIDSMSEELRLANQGEGRTTWLVGAYFFENQRTRELDLDFGSGFDLFQKSKDEVKNRALFANVEFRFKDNVFVTFGMRYDAEKRTQTDILSGDSASSTNNELLPSISLSYRPNEAANVYGTVSRGYHAGGPNEFGSIEAGAPPTYDPEYLTNYEIGIKSTAARAPVSYDVSIFYMNWTDQQIFTAFDPFNRFIINAGSSKVWGVEASCQFNPTDGLSLTGSVSWLDPEYSKFYDPIDAFPFGLDPQLGGNQLVDSSRLSGNISAQYIQPLGRGDWVMRLRGEAFHVGKRPFDPTNVFIADAYTVGNVYAGIQNDHVEIGLFLDNVSDTTYLTGGLPPADFAPLATLGDPRTAGVRFRYRY